MIRKLGYYCLVVMMIICVIRLTYKDQTLPTKDINDFTPTLETTSTTSTEPTYPIAVIEEPTTTNNISTDYASSNNNINTDSNVALAEETLVSEEISLSPANIKLMEITSLEDLKAQGWRFPKKADYNSDTYSEIKKYYKTSLEGDFDDNGLIDKALYMVKDNHDAYEGKERGIFVVLTQKQGDSKIFYMTDGEGLVNSGLNLIKPGLFEVNYRYPIDFQSPAIDCNFDGDAGSGQIIYWDKEQRKFLSIPNGC